MKQKLQIALLCVAFVGLSLWTSWPKGEPSWGGKTVSEWLVELAPERIVFKESESEEQIVKRELELRRRREQAQAAIRNLGHAALPYVLALVDGVPPQPGPLERLAELLGRKPPEPPEPSLLLSRAAYALEALGETARPALPCFRRMLSDTNTMQKAATCLANMGAIGVPLLAQGIASHDKPTRIRCLRCMNGVGTNAVAALPVVLAAVEDADLAVQGTAIFTYAAIEPDKDRLIYTLVGWLHSKPVKALSVLSAVQAMGVWRRPHGTEVQPLIAALIRLSDTPEEALQEKLLSTLSVFGEWCAPAKDKAEAALASPSSAVRRSACYVLSAAKLNPEATITKLLKVAETDPETSVREGAVNAMSLFGVDGLPHTGSFRPQVERTIRERVERDRLWGRPVAK